MHVLGNYAYMLGNYMHVFLTAKTKRGALFYIARYQISKAIDET